MLLVTNENMGLYLCMYEAIRHTYCPPSLAGIQTQDLPNRNQNVTNDALDRSAMTTGFSFYQSLTPS